MPWTLLCNVHGGSFDKARQVREHVEDELLMLCYHAYMVVLGCKVAGQRGRRKRALTHEHAGEGFRGARSGVVSRLGFACLLIVLSLCAMHATLRVAACTACSCP